MPSIEQAAATREAFLSAVRSNLGTPFHHQGRIPGVGLDCAGLYITAAQAAGMPVSDMEGYARLPDGRSFMECVRANARLIEPPTDTKLWRPGDALIFEFGLVQARPSHVAVYLGKVNGAHRMAHAYIQRGRSLEQTVDAWWMKRLVAVARNSALDGQEG